MSRGAVSDSTRLWPLGYSNRLVKALLAHHRPFLPQHELPIDVLVWFLGRERQVWTLPGQYKCSNEVLDTGTRLQPTRYTLESPMITP